MANKTKFTWQAPTENTDGTAIDYPLDYELGVAVDTIYQPVSVFPGTLNPDGTYEALIANFAAFDAFGTYEVVLRAINRNNPTAISDWSAPLVFTLSAEIPTAPLAFAAA